MSRGAVQVRPTVFGAALALVVGVVAVRVPGATDPAVAGVVWGTLVAVLVVGACWPPLALAGVDVVVVAAPADAVVGGQIEVVFDLRGRARGLEVLVHDGVAESGWSLVSAPARGAAGIPALRRGIRTTLVVAVRSSAPLGVVTVTRRWRVELHGPIHVAPRPEPMVWSPTLAPVPSAVVGWSARGRGDEELVGVRPYLPGDPLRAVHWPSTARVGAVVVRDLEPPSQWGAAIRCELDGSDADELRASRAAGLVEAITAVGGVAMLCTNEEGVPVAAAAGDDAGRRLAKAGAGPTAAPAGWREIVA